MAYNKIMQRIATKILCKADDDAEGFDIKSCLAIIVFWLVSAVDLDTIQFLFLHPAVFSSIFVMVSH